MVLQRCNELPKTKDNSNGANTSDSANANGWGFSSSPSSLEPNDGILNVRRMVRGASNMYTITPMNLLTTLSIFFHIGTCSTKSIHQITHVSHVRS
jgi:hypothetical protein